MIRVTDRSLRLSRGPVLDVYWISNTNIPLSVIYSKPAPMLAWRRPSNTKDEFYTKTKYISALLVTMWFFVRQWGKGAETFDRWFGMSLGGAATLRCDERNAPGRSSERPGPGTVATHITLYTCNADGNKRAFTMFTSLNVFEKVLPFHSFCFVIIFASTVCTRR